jgi:hypothetical protein|tara:strand:- start:608 stop:847 length:240 start_codon:yes stop_codon:yes gene_type:complete
MDGCKLKTLKQILEGLPKGSIAGFDGDEGEIVVYKQGTGFYGDDGESDFKAKNVKELKSKIKAMGGNPNKPSFGELPKK